MIILIDGKEIDLTNSVVTVILPPEIINEMSISENNEYTWAGDNVTKETFEEMCKVHDTLTQGE